MDIKRQLADIKALLLDSQKRVTVLKSEVAVAFREIRHLKEKLTTWGSQSETSLSLVSPSRLTSCMALTLARLHGPDPGKVAWP